MPFLGGVMENGIMGNFFHGWRRKVGLLTLVMACLFMAGWVRSSIFHDSAGFEEAGRLDALGSYQGRIYMMQIIANGKDRNKPSQSKFVWSSVTLSDPRNRMLHLPKIKWHFYGTRMREMTDDRLRIVVSEVSYWLVAIPLTLISLLLFLSKPRKATPNKIVEPIPEKVAGIMSQR
jgi:hypothetical protein